MAELSFAFVCVKADEDDERHTTSTAMVKCTYCGSFAVAGYWCDTCGHTDVGKPDELIGHGPGKCLPASAASESGVVPEEEINNG
jgi:hypothetical protein